MNIACDIGGVVKNLINDEPIEGAVESIKLLEEKHKIIFISKCKESYKDKILKWLKEHNLDNITIYFCEDYKDKIQIAENNKINVMIDDKMQVLCTFPKSIKKIWFSDDKKIEGAKKYQPYFYNSVQIAKKWTDIIKLLK
jgi:uncharacterized HAD superfamily protein